VVRGGALPESGRLEEWCYSLGQHTIERILHRTAPAANSRHFREGDLSSLPEMHQAVPGQLRMIISHSQRCQAMSSTLFSSALCGGSRRWQAVRFLAGDNPASGIRYRIRYAQFRGEMTFPGSEWETRRAEGAGFSAACRQSRMS
jgi:hypothetical protein